MASSKRTHTTSAMVDLKAELHRKQEEFRRHKVDHGHNIKGHKPEKLRTKKSVWAQQNPGLADRASKDVTDTVEEEKDLDKSRRMLAHKTKLYEEMASSSYIPDDDGAEGFLVDFQRKVVDRMVGEREEERKRDEDKREDAAEKEALAQPVPEPVDEDDEWVDFTDRLGRQRRCMKKDVGRMRELDQNLAGTTRPTSEPGGVGGGGGEPPSVLASDAFRDKMRQKWEAEERALVDTGQEDMHYANVQFDEIRTHGVGYYQFSKDHQVRQEQMETLNHLREETEKETSRQGRVQAKRKAVMDARLAKVRERRKLKEDKNSDNKSEEEKTAEMAKKAEEEERKRKEEEEAEREAREVRKNYMREWDKEKQKSTWPGKGHMESRRNQREAEFAPPSVYFNNSGGPNTKSVSDESRMARLKQSTHSHRVGPELAPPSCYHGQRDKKRKEEEEVCHRANQGKNQTPTTDADARAPDPRKGNSVTAEKSQRGGNQHTNPKPSNPVDSVPLASIPLPPASDHRVDSTGTDESSNKAVPSSLNGTSVAGCQQGVEMPEPDWHQYQQHPHCHQPSSRHHQPQQVTPEPWMAQQQQQHQQYNQHPPGFPHVSIPQQPHPYQPPQPYQTQPQPYQPPQPSQTLPPLSHPYQPPQPYQTQPQSYQPAQPQSYQTQPQSYQTQPQSYQTQPQSYQPPQSYQTQPQSYQPPQPSQTQPHPSQTPPPPCQTLPPPHHHHPPTKRPLTTGTSPQAKVPKSTIMDTRNILNHLPETKWDSNPSPADISAAVEAVPYQPGSFTAARFPQGDTSIHSAVDMDHQGSSTAPIAGSPQLYSKPQLEEQQKQLEEDGGEADQKLNDFLASIRAETK